VMVVGLVVEGWDGVEERGERMGRGLGLFVRSLGVVGGRGGKFISVVCCWGGGACLWHGHTLIIDMYTLHTRGDVGSSTRKSYE